MVKLLLTAGADPNSKDYRKATPLFIACVSNHVEIVQVRHCCASVAQTVFKLCIVGYA